MHYRLFPLIALFALPLLAQDVALQGLTGGNYRFKDIGGQAFGQNFISAYAYPSASVVFSLDTPGVNYLAGNITATGLKPNFAYQIKLGGNPSKAATTPEQLAAADDATNERLGRMGRWWRAKPTPGNSTDADYDANKDNPDYVFEGYLLIGFFVTDAQGNANLRFEGRNSFHVLWRIDQRPRGPSDGPVLPVTVPETTGNPAYDATVPARQYQLYGEWEPTRAQPGALEMMLGHYRCRLVLTEESFHDSGPLAGNWTSALSAPLEFDIPTASAPPTSPPAQDGSSALPLEITGLRARINRDSGGHDFAEFSGALQLPPNFAPRNMEVQATAMGALRMFELNRGGVSIVRDGRFILRAARDGSGKARFKLRLRRGVLALEREPGPCSCTDPNPAAFDTAILTLKLGADEYRGWVHPKMKFSDRRQLLSFGK